MSHYDEQREAAARAEENINAVEEFFCHNADELVYVFKYENVEQLDSTYPVLITVEGL